jgi:hypothetical protein
MALRTPPAWLQAGSYTAENDRLTAQASYTTTGIVGLSSMAVTAQASPNMTVNVASGWAAIVGGNATNQGAYLAYNDATTILTVTSADPSLPRIDRVVATVSDAAYSGSSNQVVFQVLAGTPNASPSAPAVPTNSISLATISIAAASTTIAQTAITDTRVPADSSLVYAKPGANAIINGAMEIWQRGTGLVTATSATTGYVVDRWQMYRAGYATGGTTYQPSGPQGFQYAARVQRDSGNASTAGITFAQSLESKTSIPFAGGPVTLSFWARAGANYSSASNALLPSIVQGTGTDQNISGGFTSQTNVVSSSVTLTTSWQRFSVTGTVATASTQLGVSFYYTPVGTAGANDYFEVTGVQLEAGSIATAFRRAAGTIQGELAACQRYYYRINVYGSGYAIAFGSSVSTSAVDFMFPKDMRGGGVSSLDYSSLQIYRLAGQTLTNVNTPTLTFATPTQTWVRLTGNVGQFTATPENVELIGSANGGYLGFSAEL